MRVPTLVSHAWLLGVTFSICIHLALAKILYCFFRCNKNEAFVFLFFVSLRFGQDLSSFLHEVVLDDYCQHTTQPSMKILVGKLLCSQIQHHWPHVVAVWRLNCCVAPQMLDNTGMFVGVLLWLRPHQEYIGGSLRQSKTDGWNKSILV